MTEEKLLDHVISRLEPQILDYVEVRRPQTTSNLLQIIDKYEKRFLNRKLRGSSREFRDVNQSENNRFPNRNRQENWRETRGNNSDRCESGGDQSRSTENPPDTEHRTIRISSLRITPVDLPYVPILLNETFITALWDTGAEKSFISEEVYRRYFSYRPRQKTNDRVVTAQGAPCCHIGWVELQIRIREFQKTWEFPILNNMQYQCILGIDFMKESKLT
ncbi:uncharacterized protein TNCV_3039041 [Trichonephila clavipes]|nr:uncharacterized protein TNCV_3039041 [Trichonephila clavipes]